MRAFPRCSLLGIDGTDVDVSSSDRLTNLTLSTETYFSVIAFVKFVVRPGDFKVSLHQKRTFGYNRLCVCFTSKQNNVDGGFGVVVELNCSPVPVEFDEFPSPILMTINSL